MTHLVKIGNLVTPNKRAREGWKESIEAAIAAHGAEVIDHEWLDATLTSDEEWELQQSPITGLSITRSS